MEVIVPVLDLPGALQDFLPYVTTEVDPYVSPLSRCTLTTPHNKHRWGEGMQQTCTGISGISAGVTPERMAKRIAWSEHEIQKERDRITEAQARLDRRLIDHQTLLLAAHIVNRLNGVTTA